MISLAGFTRRRKALVAAVLPYLLLSVFVDFVHLHRLINGPLSVASASARLTTDDGTATKLPEASCAICQWLRAGSGMQPAVTTQQAPVLITAPLVACRTLTPSRPDLGSPDFRGPPSSLSL